MPRTCSICRHSRRSALEKLLVAGQSYRFIAERFSVSASAVGRHLPHVSKKMRERRESMEALASMSLVDQVRSLHVETLGILESAKKSADSDTMLRAIARLEKQLALFARLVGELPEASVNVLVVPEWRALRAAVMRGVDGFPAAREAVLAELAQLGPSLA